MSGLTDEELKEIVTTPPAGNEPSAPGQRQITPTCNHAWVPYSRVHAVGLGKGKMYCVWCGAIVPAPLEASQPFQPEPADRYTGY